MDYRSRVVRPLPPVSVTVTWTSLHAQVHRTLRQRHLFTPGQRLLVAVSGGQDSLCLLKLLLDLRPHWHWQLAIGHCDHRWRSDSAANAAHVQTLAEQWQLPFWLQTAAEIPRTEAQARTWRYEVLTEIAQTQNYTAVVTGHTASDRAETLLFNLLRGSGTDGLQALVWQRSLATGLQLVRPLLGLTRTQTGDFCREQNLPIWEDSTNQDYQYRRNRIRQELIPYLQTHFNPQVEQAIAQTAELLQAEVDYLEAQAQALLAQVSTMLPERGLNRSSLQAVPLALQRRVVKGFLQTHLPHAPNFDQVEKVVALISAANGSRTDPFPGGAIATVSDAWIYLVNSNH